MNGTLSVTRYTLIELTRRRILIVFFVIGAVGIGLLGLGLKLLLTANPTAFGGKGSDLDPAKMNQLVDTFFVTELFSVLGIFALLIAFAIGMTAIYHDLDSGAAVSIFSKPVSRLAFTVGKLIAAVVALVVIVGVLGLEARGVMFLFGGGLENALWLEIAAVVANTVVLMLIVLTLSTWMNNIVAAVVAFIYHQVVVGVVVLIHNFAHQGVISNGFVKAVFDVVYWLVPHPLVSSAIRDLTLAQINLSSSSSGPPPSDVLIGLPPVSGIGDIAWWAFLVLLFSATSYYTVRRRQV